MAVIDGINLVIYINGNAVGHAKTHSLSLNDATIDITSKDSAGWEAILAGLKGGTLSGDGLVDLTDSYTVDDIFTAYAAGTQISWKFSTNTSSEKYFTGNGFFTALDQSAANKEAVTYSFSIKVDGAVTNPTLT